MSFFKNLFGAHGKKIIREVTDQVVALDPATATQAQLATMEESLDKVGNLLANLRVDYNREQKEADAIQVRYDRQAAAAKQLFADADAETDAVKKAAIEKSLNALLDATDKLKTQLEQEKQEAVDALALLKETESQFEEKALQLKEAKKQLESAARDMARAKVQQDRAETQAENAARLAGLRDNEVGGLNSALNAMTRQADEARAAAEAAKAKAAALSKKDVGAEDDPLVAAALAKVSDQPTKSAADRIASL